MVSDLQFRPYRASTSTFAAINSTHSSLSGWHYSSNGVWGARPRLRGERHRLSCSAPFISVHRYHRSRAVAASRFLLPPQAMVMLLGTTQQCEARKSRLAYPHTPTWAPLPSPQNLHRNDNTSSLRLRFRDLRWSQIPTITGKGEPAGNLGSTLPGPCPHLLCGMFFEIDSSSLLEFF